MKIEVGKFYITSSGAKVRIYAIDGVGKYSVHGAYFTGTGWESTEWTFKGSSIYDCSEDIVSEWIEFNYSDQMRKSFAVAAGTWILNFPPNRNLIETYGRCELPNRLRGKQLEITNWVTTNEIGHFEGTSIEDVRFIPESKYFKPVPLNEEHGFNYIINENIKDNLLFLIPPMKREYISGNWGIPKTFDELKIEYPPKSKHNDHFFDAMKYHLDNITKANGISPKDLLSIANNVIIDQSNHVKPRKGIFVDEEIGYFRVGAGRIGFSASNKTISAICSCGGKIDSHKPECPENQEAMNEIQPFYYIDDSPKRYLGMPDRKKCECGSDSLGSPKHSHWCAKYEKVD